MTDKKEASPMHLDPSHQHQNQNQHQHQHHGVLGFISNFFHSKSTPNSRAPSRTESRKPSFDKATESSSTLNEISESNEDLTPPRSGSHTLRNSPVILTKIRRSLSVPTINKLKTGGSPNSTLKKTHKKHPSGEHHKHEKHEKHHKHDQHDHHSLKQEEPKRSPLLQKIFEREHSDQHLEKPDQPETDGVFEPFKTERPPSLVEPKEVGPDDFEILKLLGRGDAGKVYLVVKKDEIMSSKAKNHGSATIRRNLKGDQKLYAMKVLSKEEMVKRQKVKRALTEREILTNAHHPFIVPLYHCFQSQTHLYFILEYCGGGEFFRTLQKQPNQRIPEVAAKHYAAEVVLALEYIHMMGYVYRDLKPENILLHSSGHIMLADFDLSTRVEHPGDIDIIYTHSIFSSKPQIKGVDTSNVVCELRSQSFVGTEEYIAPEMITSVGHSANVDWWTLGIFLYEMLYGTTPFKGSGRADTFKRILEIDPVFPEQPPVSNHCKNLIKKLLQKNEKKRLGAIHGASDVKRDPFFHGVNWALLRNTVPPIIPSHENIFEKVKEPGIKDSAEFKTGDEKALDVSEIDAEDPFKGFESVTIVRSNSEDGSDFEGKR